MFLAAAACLAVLQGAPELPQQDDPWERLSLSADGRLRAESTHRLPSGDDRYRGRMRFRLRALYELFPTLLAQARVTTTSGDTNNPHWDFGDGEQNFEGSDLRLDRFSVAWSPSDELRLEAGQFAHVFVDPPIFDEVVWDDDIQPAGLAAVVGPGPGAGVGYDLRLAGYVVVENAVASDPSMLGAQANLYVPWGGRSNVHLATSLMSWSNLGQAGSVLDNQGNTDVMGEFLIWEGFVAASYEGGPLGRTTGFAQLMQNIDDSVGEDVGFAAGLMFGHRRRAGATNAFVSVYDLDANAIFSPPAQDATPIPGTGLGSGMNGVFAGVEHWLNDRVSIEFTVLTSDAGASDDPLRLRLDLDFAIP